MKKKSILLVFLFFLANCFSYAEPQYNIDYYGVASTVLDKNMALMTSDFFYTQLCEIHTFSITDKRASVKNLSELDKSILEDGKLSFYTVITQKKGTSKWLATMHVFNKATNSEYTETKEYDSFYKILMENKSALKESFISLVQNEKQSEKNNNAKNDADNLDFQQPSRAVASTDSLAGTWQGEQNIEKIVIMRGGRGFVIFKNGASMTVKIEVDDSRVTIAQTGKPNASFFPELPRATALEAALNADPITWKMELTGNNTLAGTKQTLLPNGNDTKKAELSVVWNRKM